MLRKITLSKIHEYFSFIDEISKPLGRVLVAQVFLILGYRKVIYYEETEGNFRASLNDQFKDLSVYEGGIQYIVDFLNGSNNIDNKIWNLNYHQMYEAAEAWHQQLATQGKDFRDNMGKLGYMTNKVVYKFKNGYSIVEVDAEKTSV